MAFTFQINSDLKFRHDEALLAKSEQCRPVIRRQEVTPVRIVELMEDPSKLNGVWVTESEKKIADLKSYGLKIGRAHV